MKYGKFILSTISLVITAGTLVGFKAHRKIIVGARAIYGKTANGCCTAAKSCFTTHSGGAGIGFFGKCHTMHSFFNPLTLKTLGAGRLTMWTFRTTLNDCRCTHPIKLWTKTH